VPYASSYSLQWRYANGSSDNRSGSLTVNGQTQATVDLVSTGAWTSWTTASTVINLEAGENRIRLVATMSGGLANIDSLTLVGNELQTGGCEQGTGPILSQDGNPVHSRFNSAKTKWGTGQADIVLSYQYDNGGWPKNQTYDTMGSGGNASGTIDNGATVTEMIYLAQNYKNTGNTQYRNAVRNGMDFILASQYSTGGWPQIWPLTGGYSDHVTYNDNAMANVLTMLHHASQGNAPFDNDTFTDTDRAAMQRAINNGVEYILNSQWRQNGALTVWCAQHGATDYLPKMARAYELESLSGSESVEVIAFLMTQPQTAEIEAAVKAAIAWFRSPNTILEDYTYTSSVEEKFVYSPGSRVWYRFYDLYTNEGFFSDRDSRKVYDIMGISEERRNGYSWGGSYGEKIISYANNVGY